MDGLYGKCAKCSRYNTSFAWCQSCDPFKTTQGWTSGDNDIDNCIKEFQLKSTSYESVIEWIPFDRLYNVHKIEESKFQAQWLDGVRKIKNKDEKHTLYGITQDTITGQYMVVFDDFYSIRNIIYGYCTQCEGFDTSEAWCQSCDPFKTTQGWT
ncbi:12765_t:CDS:2, partial [Acaulospora morrowiae]